MALQRRRVLRTAGVSTLVALAGCSSLSGFGLESSTETYVLRVDSIDASPVEYALYEPDESPLFGDPARTALEAVLPDGRQTTYGYTPLPDGDYVTHEGRYYQLSNTVTGRERMERTLVRAERVPSDDVPADPVRLDSLERPSARVVKILHSHTQSGGESMTALLHGSAYVLRRPAERRSRLATGDLDGRVVTMTDSDAWAYRLHVTREPVVETAYTALAIEVAESRAAFRDVVFGARIDVDLSPSALAPEARDRLVRAIDRGEYNESTPLSGSFDALLAELDLAGVDESVTGRLLWYDGGFYRYALYIQRDEH